jgi:steroid 5-alpha reductase family enzyme
MWIKSAFAHLLLSFFFFGTASSFAVPAVTSTPIKPINIRGGAMTSLYSLPVASLGEGIAAISSSLQSGPYGVLALSAVTWSVVLPLTLYKKVYGIGVAYGFSVFAAGLALLKVFPSEATSGVLLAQACMFYGARLGSYLLVRDAARKKESTIKNGSISSRVTFSLSLALFYAFLTTPVLYAMRVPVTSSIATGGAYLAWFGAVLEAIADAQKFIVKQANKGVEDKFVGPTSFAYQISRHPNYLGEVLFWTGLFVGGAPSFGTSITAWVCSGLGLAGIVSIMLKAASGLEKRQQERYGGQEKYESWKKQVSSSLIPFIK